MSKPEPHGIDGEFRLKETTAKQLKVDKFFTTMPAVQWSNISEMITLHIEYNEGFCKPEETFKSLLNSFESIGNKTSFKSLSLYSHALKSYYGTYKLKFTQDYKKMLETYEAKKNISQEADLASMMLTTQGISKIKRKASIEANQKMASSKKRVTGTSSSSIIPLHPPQPVPPQYDEVKVPGRDDTVSTVLKVEGFRLHTKFKNGESLTRNELKRMSSSLSSILDLIDNSVDGQKVLFTDSQWEHLRDKFMPEKGICIKNISEDLQITWKLIAKFAELNGTLHQSKIYLEEIINNTNNFKDKNILKLFSIIIEIFEDNDLLFDLKYEHKFTEGDYVSIVWGPIIRKIISYKKIIRLKVGESVNGDSSKNKKLQYESETQVIGPKIDMRFVVDLDTDLEVDVGSAECAKPCPSESKVFHDQEKLVKEGKDIVDGVINRLHQVPIKEIAAPILQIAGLVGEISRVNIVAPGLYTATPVSKTIFPSSIASFEPMINTLDNIISTITTMEKMAVLLKKADLFFEERRRSFGLKFGRPLQIKTTNSYQTWIRDTYYFPTNGLHHKSAIPADFQEEIAPCFSETSDEASGSPMAVSGEVDKNGWTLVEDGRYYNTLINVYSTKNPTCPSSSSSN